MLSLKSHHSYSRDKNKPQLFNLQKAMQNNVENSSMTHISENSLSEKITSIPQTITLTEHEEKIFKLLVEFTDFLKREKPNLPPITLRVAGGWVRDKVINYHCMIFCSS